ncbi:M48 family metallopeptidase [Streptomyces sp. 35G-GA-8]|uniref:M48 family metalloprotease n=1 Tax=Streptomyces sp. 35G-GA-8 TaxID=2939434 RepID=UPI00201F76C1|nr:M48 family metallopeptidase [Streptomyces sp. 35G-GA-8]MCL7380360.1 M48 family metalloprotease [Streptomyces sp. 35G-GA-8]
MSAVLGWLRGLFAVGLLAGFYVVASALLVTDVALVAAMLWLMVEAPSRAGNWSLVLGGSIPAAVALLYGIATVSRTEEHPPAAVLVSRAEAPGLWRLVEDLAGRLRTRPPDRIYLTPEANASVSEKARLLGFAVGDRTMYLGVPLLKWLKPMELRAVLCHELGHYAGRHTRFGALTYRGAAALGSALFRLRMTARSEEARLGYAWLFHSVISCYGWLYFRLSLAVRRRQELEADAEAVAAVGPAVTADALRAVHALALTWAGFESRYLRPVQRLGFAPEDVFEAFAAMLDDPCVRERMADLREHPVEEGRSPLDSHPPLARRLALIEARPAGDTPDVVDDGPLVTADRPVRRVRQSMLDKAGGPVTELSVTTWADLAAEAFAVELASLLLDAARGVGVTARPTLATVLDLLERGEPAELIRRLTDAPEPEEQLAEALYALTGQALAGAGRARWKLSWTHGYLLHCPRPGRPPGGPGSRRRTRPCGSTRSATGTGPPRPRHRGTRRAGPAYRGRAGRAYDRSADHPARPGPGPRGTRAAAEGRQGDRRRADRHGSGVGRRPDRHGPLAALPAGVPHTGRPAVLADAAAHPAAADAAGSRHTAAHPEPEFHAPPARLPLPHPPRAAG